MGYPKQPGQDAEAHKAVTQACLGYMRELGAIEKALGLRQPCEQSDRLRAIAALRERVAALEAVRLGAERLQSDRLRSDPIEDHSDAERALWASLAAARPGGER